MKKYVVIGGYVNSKDGDLHYISPLRLCELYGVNPREVFMADNDNDYRLRGLDLYKLAILRPSEDGNYNKEQS